VLTLGAEPDAAVAAGPMLITEAEIKTSVAAEVNSPAGLIAASPFG
jgi:hypothetical protein